MIYTKSPTTWNVADIDMLKYISLTQAAKAASLSRQRLSVLCTTGRIDGSFKVGHNWAIPNPFGISPDPRIKHNLALPPSKPGE